jgi:3-oxoadipate enol-lactonase
VTGRDAESGIVYDVEGDRGPAVVLPSSFFLSRRAWAPLAREAARHYRVFSYDLRNQGDSADAADGFGFQTHIDDLRSLLDAHDIGQAWLVGTSLSTLICRDFAGQHPSRVAGMVLCGPVFGVFGARRRNYFIRAWLRTLEAGGMADLFAQLYPLLLSDRAIQYSDAIGFLALREAFIGLHASAARLGRSLSAFADIDDRPDRLQEIGCPVLLMAGDGDALAGQTALAMTSRLLPDAQHLVLPGAGHLPYLDTPARFQQVLLEFIDGHARDMTAGLAAAG